MRLLDTCEDEEDSVGSVKIWGLKVLEEVADVLRMSREVKQIQQTVATVHDEHGTAAIGWCTLCSLEGVHWKAQPDGPGVCQFPDILEKCNNKRKQGVDGVPESVDAAAADRKFCGSCKMYKGANIDVWDKEKIVWQRPFHLSPLDTCT
ncbi:uncharacterized protein F5147DRAFT_653043 [Suillus discolor]|uniref:Uncharacterized protein n=1 Tax=Suillus discolor TaxID=1912936 RepID=A0A9P7F7U0_9AGAM|nr:uncharacterized protein F5147DRAFT_653043 [Suillus discolor]KAG2107941.1 hypothetical protein F5147DRAFT_653043 [Suillus discolor]